MTLGSQIVDLVWLDLAGQIGSVAGRLGTGEGVASEGGIEGQGETIVVEKGTSSNLNLTTTGCCPLQYEHE